MDLAARISPWARAVLAGSALAVGLVSAAAAGGAAYVFEYVP